MATASMFESGAYSFEKFRENQPFQTRWLGEFDPEMTGEAANEKLGHIGKLANYAQRNYIVTGKRDRKSTRLNSSHLKLSRMPSSA